MIGNQYKIRSFGIFTSTLLITHHHFHLFFITLSYVYRFFLWLCFLLFPVYPPPPNLSINPPALVTWGLHVIERMHVECGVLGCHQFWKWFGSQCLHHLYEPVHSFTFLLVQASSSTLVMTPILLWASSGVNRLLHMCSEWRCLSPLSQLCLELLWLEVGVELPNLFHFRLYLGFSSSIV